MERKRSEIAQLPSGKFYAPSEEKAYKEQKAAEEKTKSQHEGERKARKLAFTKELVRGLIHMVDGQRQFADEFGLSMSRVFPNSYQSLEGRNVDDFVMSMFRSDWQSLAEISALLNDLLLHQVSLMSSLDGIAIETLYQMGDEDLVDERGRLNDSRAWRMHKDRVQELLSNGNLRFERIVSKGFVEHYIRSVQERVRSQNRREKPKSKVVKKEEVVW